jgi:hypothetical protein
MKSLEEILFFIILPKEGGEAGLANGCNDKFESGILCVI